MRPLIGQKVHASLAKAPHGHSRPSCTRHPAEYLGSGKTYLDRHFFDPRRGRTLQSQGYDSTVDALDSPPRPMLGPSTQQGGEGMVRTDLPATPHQILAPHAACRPLAPPAVSWGPFNSRCRFRGLTLSLLDPFLAPLTATRPGSAHRDVEQRERSALQKYDQKRKTSPLLLDRRAGGPHGLRMLLNTISLGHRDVSPICQISATSANGFSVAAASSPRTADRLPLNNSLSCCSSLRKHEGMHTAFCSWLSVVSHLNK